MTCFPSRESVQWGKSQTTLKFSATRRQSASSAGVIIYSGLRISYNALLTAGTILGIVEGVIVLLNASDLYEFPIAKNLKEGYLNAVNVFLYFTFLPAEPPALWYQAHQQVPKLDKIHHQVLDPLNQIHLVEDRVVVQ